MAEEVQWKELKLGDRIGSGSFGIVYKATWKTRQNLEIAVKKFNETIEDTDIEKEVKSLLLVKHENIVRFYGTTKNDEKRNLILMEYIDGGSLCDFLHGSGKDQKYSYYDALNWMLQCSKGIAHMHGMKPKVLHRDLNTKNLLLDNNFRTLKICDFGKVRELATKMTDGPVGTAPYIAPEASSGHSYTEMCDVYSFGIILWEIFSRKKPFYHLENNKDMAILLNAFKGERPPLSDITIVKNSSALKSLIEQCWHKDPSKRPIMKHLSHFWDLWTAGIESEDHSDDSIEEDFEYISDWHFEESTQKNLISRKHIILKSFLLIGGAIVLILLF